MEEYNPSLEREIKFKILEEMFRCHDSIDRSRLRAFVDKLDADIQQLREEEAYFEWQTDRKSDMEDENGSD